MVFSFWFWCFVFWCSGFWCGDGAIVMVSLFVYVQYACLLLCALVASINMTPINLDCREVFSGAVALSDGFQCSVLVFCVLVSGLFLW